MTSATTSRYEVLAKIAAGGMATVYVGRVRGAVGFSRLVAIKRPHPFVAADPDLHAQLEHEARVASMIHHPNVVAVLDVEEVGGETVLIMSYVEGCTAKDLFQYVQTTNASIDRILLRILLDAAAGLHAAHCLKDAAGAPLGVVHRDVSPHNILVGLDGVGRLADFGIAKIATLDVEHTATGVLKGKIAYMPPEYLTTKLFDAKSDLFSLAVVTWEAFARQRLYKGATTVETILRIIENRPPPLSTIRPELSVFEKVVAQALSRDPRDRPDSVEAFAATLEAVARAEDGVATHAEVRAFMEKFFGVQIAERRRLIEQATPQLVATESGNAERSARDDVPTATFDAAAVVGAIALEPAPASLLVGSARSHKRTWIAGVLSSLLAIAIYLGFSARVPERPSVEEPDAAPARVDDVAPPPTVSTELAAQVAGEDAAFDAGSRTHLAAGSPNLRQPRSRPRAPHAPSSLAPTHAPPNPYVR